MKNIIFIEDDELDFTIFKEVLLEIDSQLIVTRIIDPRKEKFKEFLMRDTVIFLDLNLGTRTGFEIFEKELRDLKVPVYIHSSSDDPEDISKSQGIGLSGYFLKQTGTENIKKQFLAILNYIKLNKLSSFIEVDSRFDEISCKVEKLKKQNIDLMAKVDTFRSNNLYPRNGFFQGIENKDDFFLQLTKKLPTGIYIYNTREKKNIYINKNYEEITGYSLEDLNRMGADEFLSLFHPDDLDEVLNHMEEVTQSKKSEVITIKYRFKHKDGEWIELLSLDRTFDLDSSGEPISFLGSFIKLNKY